MLRCSQCHAEVTRLTEKCACGTPTLNAETVCGGCGAATSRTRQIYGKEHQLTREECDMCAPNSFDPQWLHARGVMGWEAYPKMYRKTAMPDGSTGYVGTDELRADTEARIMRADPDDELAGQRAIEHKRATRRTAPLTQGEIESVTQRIREQRAIAQAQAAGLELVN